MRPSLAVKGTGEGLHLDACLGQSGERLVGHGRAPEVKASTATSGGRHADRWGKRNALALGWAVYAVTWSAVGWASSTTALFALTAAYGTSHGLVEGAEKALVAELATEGGRGRAFGTYNLWVGLSALAAITAFGAVWDGFGSEVAFTGSGLCALVAAGLLLYVVRR